MAKAPKKTAAKKPPTKITAEQADKVNAVGDGVTDDTAAVQGAIDKASSAHTPQTGMEPGPTAKELREEHNKRFAEADEKGQAAMTEEVQVGLQVRGY